MNKLRKVIISFVILSFCLTWTACEKEKDKEKHSPELFVWLARSNKSGYVLQLYGDSTLLEEYEYDGQNTAYRVYETEGGYNLIKTELDTAKVEIRIYQDGQLISTCRYEKERYRHVPPTQANYYRIYISGSDVYVTGYFIVNKGYDSLEYVLWKNNEIIWAKRLEFANGASWRGFGCIGQDWYGLLPDWSYTYLYKNGELVKTYPEEGGMSEMTISGKDIYRWKYYYQPGKIWRNDELIFSVPDDWYSFSMLRFYGDDWYISQYNGGRIWKNGEELYNISYKSQTVGLGKTKEYHVDMYNVYMIGMDLYSTGQITERSRDHTDVIDQDYAVVWKNGEVYQAYKTDWGKWSSIQFVFKK